VRIVLLGPPGSGKGTQAQRLSPYLGIPHVSTGELFRHNITAGTALGLRAQAYVDAGDLVPASLTNALINDRLADPDAAQGFILDGYPRSVDQAKALRGMLAERNVGIDAVLEFQVSEAEVVQRLSGRGRADDTGLVIQNRLAVYHDETAPLRGYYQDRLAVVEATGTVDEIFAQALQVLLAALNR
jgi:adenylate kinase